MVGHEDPKGHVEIRNGKAVLVMDEEVKKEESKSVNKESFNESKPKKKSKRKK